MKSIALFISHKPSRQNIAEPQRSTTTTLASNSSGQPESATTYAVGAATLSGTSTSTSVTACSKSSTTLSPFVPFASLIAFTFSSASLLASSSAFLLPLECYKRYRQRINFEACLARAEERGIYLSLELLELILFLFLVLFDFFLGFGSGVLYSFGAV
jgi:hypothetical protein